MWAQYYAFVQAKGHRAVRLTKVKGHAAREMVKAGIVNEVDRLGSDFADTFADLAVDLFGEMR